MPIGPNAIRLADDVKERDLIETRPFKDQHFDITPVPRGSRRARCVHAHERVC